MDAFARLVESLSRHDVRFVIIGVAGANYYARSAHALFATQDRDILLAPEPHNVLAAWAACEDVGLTLVSGDEPLDQPRDRYLAERVIANRALIRATDGAGLDVDFTLVMAGFEFQTVWRNRRVFRVDDVEIPVARLLHIVESKRLTGRDKDRLFFAAHADAIRDLVASDRRRGARTHTAKRRIQRHTPRRPPRR